MIATLIFCFFEAVIKQVYPVRFVLIRHAALVHYNRIMQSLSHLKDSVDFAKINWLNLLKSFLVVVAFFIFSWLRGSICFTDMRMYQAQILIDCLTPFLAILFLCWGRRVPYSLGLVMSAPFWLFSCFAPICVAGAALFSFNKLTRLVGIGFFALLGFVGGLFVYSHFSYAPIIELIQKTQIGSNTVVMYRCNLLSPEFDSYDIAVETPIIPGLMFSNGIDEFETIDPTPFEKVDANHIRYYSEEQAKIVALESEK